MQESEAGERLDGFLARHLSVSRAEVRRWLEEGVVQRDGRPLRPAHKGRRVRPGERYEVAAPPPPQARRPLPQPELPLPVLARGAGWIAVDKAPGQAVHPLRAGETGSVLNAVMARHPEVWGVGEGGLRSGVVHRLDVETSGVLLVALSEPAWQRLREAFRRHRVDKRYRALLHGRLEGEGCERLRLRVARHRPARVRPARSGERGGQPTELRWRALESFGDATLVEVRPRTGFLHQIRATFAHRGHPLWGDRRYGAPAEPWPVARHMLHAARLGVQDVEVESPDPDDLAGLLERLRAARSREASGPPPA